MTLASAVAFFDTDAVKSVFEKQISSASTELPTHDDFCIEKQISSASTVYTSMFEKQISGETGDSKAEPDIYEARGGLAEQLVWQLPERAGEGSLTALPLALAGAEEFDPYEARGGIAGQLRTAVGMAMDEYEARGSMVDQVYCRLPSPGVQLRMPPVLEGDEYELRGGFAGRQAALEDASCRNVSAGQGKLNAQADIYAARGSMAVDEYEVRVAAWRLRSIGCC